MGSRKLPSWQFYPGDWMKDAELRSVSPAARGMWIDLLCMMFESRRRGFLLVNGRPPTLEQIARMTGFLSTEEAFLCLTELETSGVCSRSEPNSDGEAVLFNRRMVRDEAKRVQASVNGRKGGNPRLVANPDNRQSKGGVKGGVNRKGGSSSSTSVMERENRAADGAEFSESLVALAEDVLGPTPLGQLRLLVCDGHPLDWIEEAIKETGFRRIGQGNAAVQYTRKILQRWRKDGGMPKNESDGKNRADDRGKGRGRREEPGKFADLDAANFGD